MYRCVRSVGSPIHSYIGIGNIDASIKAIFYDKSFVASTESIPHDAYFGLLLDKTSFYAEAGGQEYDTGNIVIDGVADFEVTDVQVYNGYVLHTGRLKYGNLKVEDVVVSSYDEVSETGCGLFLFLVVYSFVVGRCGTTTPRRTSSISVYVKFSVTISTKKDH